MNANLPLYDEEWQDRGEAILNHINPDIRGASMYKWEFKGRVNGHLILDTDNQNIAVKPQWSIEPMALELVRIDMKYSSGVYGHTIDPDLITPADFCHYMTKSRILEGEMVEGEIEYYDPEIPEGSVT